MEELDLKELLNIFWNKKLQMFLIIAIFLVIGIVYTIGFVTPMYTSSTTLVLAQSNNNNAATNTITATDITVNSKLVSTYSELVKSKNVLRQVKSNLNIDLDEDAIRKNITVSSVKDTEIIEITVTSEDASYSTKVANEIAKVFIDRVKQIYNIENVQIVDNAEVPNGPSNINHTKDIAIFILIGIVISVIYVLITNMLDTTIKDAESVEREFKLPVLASIPIYTNEPQKTKGGRR